MVAMVENAYSSMADESLEELREDVSVENIELAKVEIQTGEK